MHERVLGLHGSRPRRRHTGCSPHPLPVIGGITRRGELQLSSCCSLPGALPPVPLPPLLCCLCCPRTVSTCGFNARGPALRARAERGYDRLRVRRHCEWSPQQIPATRTIDRVRVDRCVLGSCPGPRWCSSSGTRRPRPTSHPWDLRPPGRGRRRLASHVADLISDDAGRRASPAPCRCWPNGTASTTLEVGNHLHVRRAACSRIDVDVVILDGAATLGWDDDDRRPSTTACSPLVSSAPTTPRHRRLRARVNSRGVRSATTGALPPDTPGSVGVKRRWSRPVLAVAPGDGLVVGGVGAGQPWRMPTGGCRARRALWCGVALVSTVVVERSCSGAVRESAERPLIDGVGEACIAHEAGQGDRPGA